MSKADSKASVFLLVIQDPYEPWELLGVYSTYELAKAAYEQLKPGSCPDIVEYDLDGFTYHGLKHYVSKQE